MAYDFNTLNKQKYNKIEWNIDTKDFSYAKTSELYNKAPSEKYIVKGLFFMKGVFGLQVVAIIPDRKILVTLPKSENETISELLNNSDFVSAVKNGDLSISLRQYESKTYHKKCYAVEYQNTNEIF